MALILNNKENISNKETQADQNIELITISKWRYKDYSLNEVVYNIDKNGLNVYRCIKKHNKGVYKTSNGIFSLKPQNEKLWEKLNKTVTTDDNGDFIDDFYLSGTSLKLELIDGSTYSVDLESIDNYVTGGTLTGSMLFLNTNKNQTLPGIDLSNVVNDTNTYVTNGEIIGNDLVLTFNDSSSINIDISTLYDNQNSYVTGGTYNSGNIILTLNTNDTVSISTNGILQDGSFLDFNDTPSSYTGNEDSVLAVNSSGNAVEFVSTSVIQGITKHNYITLDETSFNLNGITSQYERTLTTDELNAKEIVVYVNLSGISGSTYDYVLKLPSVISSNNVAKKLTVICKDLDISNPNLGFFVKSPWVNNGNKNRILGKGKQYEYTNVGYFTPLEKLECVEMLFDGIDWLVINGSYEQYVDFNAKSFYSPTNNNADYINR